MDIGPPELIIFLVLVLVLFGGSQLPKLARNLGRAQREFKAGLEEGRQEDAGHQSASPQGDSSG
ncbi:MAG TPA: twin-arginine translocase TatA/TatE family subunit [Ilumatobacteraceae bacterium]|nr:twin-arginine translocase TatA/TatE family subunit [Ilumatobacteraceae bacterium]